MDEQKKTEQKQGGDAGRKRPVPRPPIRPKRPGGGPQFRQDDDFNWNKVLKVVLSWSAIILLVFLVMTLFKGTEGPGSSSHTRSINNCWQTGRSLRQPSRSRS